jgi:hypothetical protein
VLVTLGAVLLSMLMAERVRLDPSEEQYFESREDEFRCGLDWLSW